MTKTRIALDLPDVSQFQPSPPRVEANLKEIERAAEDAGFKARHAPAKPETTKVANKNRVPAKFDARTLRRSKRTAQLNIAIEQEVRDRFWSLAQEMDVTSGEEVLVTLMETYDATRR